MDLHLHSPGVHTFKLPPGMARDASDRDALAERYVDALFQQGIELGAITDYNGVRLEWFEPIRRLAAQRGIVLLPGAELSLDVGKRGLHVLAIFDANVDLDSVNQFLRGLDRDPSMPLFAEGGPHRDISLRTDPGEALDRIRERFDCLLIPPHPDGDKGLLKAFTPQQAASLLRAVHFDAIEHLPRQQMERLLSCGELPRDYFDNIACVEFSDPKSLEQIGSRQTEDGIPRATYLKLSAEDVGALRLALQDSPMRVSVGLRPEARHARIVRMQVAGSGFLDNLDIAWSDWLNVLIGGRGVGKSAVLETLRYALEDEPYTDTDYREGLVRHALGSGGSVTLSIEHAIGDDGRQQYRVRRVLGEDAVVYVGEKRTSLSVRDVIAPLGGIVVFGQREINAVSSDDQYRLRLLDELIGEDVERCAARVRDCLEALRRNARELVEASATLSKREEHRQRLQKIDHELALYEKHGVRDKLRRATELKADGERLRGAFRSITALRSEYGEKTNRVVRVLQDQATELGRSLSEQKALLLEANQAVDELTSTLTELAGDAERAFSAAVEKLEAIGKRWKSSLLPLEAELNRVKQEVQAEGELDPDRLLLLTEEKTALGPLLAELGRTEERIRVLRADRAELLEKLQQLRHSEHELRRERADASTALLDGRLSITVGYKGLKKEFKTKLSALLRGSKVNDVALDALIAGEAIDGPGIARRIREGSDALQRHFNLTPAMATRLVEWFSDERRSFELETLVPDDSVSMELRVDGEPRPMEKLSAGQRATAMLLLLMALPGRILVLDQPEDDLDNRFVYEDVVKMLREQKGFSGDTTGRQLIIATHNANIPVLGDAELVLALSAEAKRASIDARASIDEKDVRELIEAILEGGEDAFKLRARKYGAGRSRYE